MKLFGHPVHLMLVHFPTALLPMDLACSLLARLADLPALTMAGFYAAVGGVALGWLALATGAMDMLLVAKNRPATLNKVLVHAGVNSFVMLGYTVFVLLALRNYPEIPPDSVLVLIAKAILILTMFVGNYLGASLILKEGIGMRTPGARK